MSGMFLRRLKVPRRFRSRNIGDVWRQHRKMRNSGKIRYWPKKFDIRLCPMKLQERCSVCWCCKKVVFTDNHYKTEHSELSKDDQQSLLKIGIALYNRFSNPGPEKQFDNERDKRLIFLDNMAAMFGSAHSKKLHHPKKRVRQRNRMLTRIHDYLDSLRTSHPMNRSCSISLDRLELCRADLDRNLNLYCVSCGKWTVGRWDQHAKRYHSELNRIESEVIRLFSCRQKAVIISSLLLVKPSVLKKRSILSQVKAAHCLFDNQPYVPNPHGCCIRPAIQYIRIRRTLSPYKYRIRWKWFETKYGEPLKGPLMVKGYQKIHSLYGTGWSGFTDIRTYSAMKEISDKVRITLQRANPPSNNSINFLSHKQKIKGQTGHVILSHFDAFQQAATLYDGSDDSVRRNPINDFLKGVLIGHHGHGSGSLRAGYSLEYSVQGETWSCSYMALFACLGIMNRKSPEDFQMDVYRTFKVMKWAVEDKGRKLESLSLDRVWNYIATEKADADKPEELVNYEVIKGTLPY